MKKGAIIPSAGTLFLAVLLGSGQILAEEKPTLVVMDLKAIGVEPNTAYLVSERMRAALSRTGKYTIASREAEETKTFSEGICIDKDLDMEVIGSWDRDKDGYGVGDLEGECTSGKDGDCDDENPEIHSGAIEICNGVDDDCDGIIEGGCGWYWSSSSYAGGSSPAWYVSFSGGDVYNSGKTNGGNVRCVRGGP